MPTLTVTSSEAAQAETIRTEADQIMEFGASDGVATVVPLLTNYTDMDATSREKALDMVEAIGLATVRRVAEQGVSTSTPNTLVRRDNNSDFSAHDITINKVTFGDGTFLTSASTGVGTFVQKSGDSMSGALSISVTSGSNALNLSLGSRLTFGSSSRYLYDDSNGIHSSTRITMDDVLIVNSTAFAIGFKAINGGSGSLTGQIANGASAVATILDNSVTLTAGKLLSLRNNTSEKLSVSFDGAVICKSVNTNGGGSLIAGGTQGVIVGTAGVGVAASSFSLDFTSGWGLANVASTEAIRVCSTTVFTAAGAKIMGWHNGSASTTPVAFLDKDGNFDTNARFIARSGYIEAASTAAGFKFPDGTIQTTAAGSSADYADALNVVAGTGFLSTANQTVGAASSAILAHDSIDFDFIGSAGSGGFP